MIRYLLILFILLPTVRSGAQDMEWSNTRRLKGSAVFTYVIGEGSNGIYLLRYRNRFFSRQVILERYRDKLGYASSQSIRLRKARLLSAELINDTIYLFTTHYDRNNAFNELKVQAFREDLEPIGEQVSLSNSSLADYYDKGDFSMKLSQDRKSFLVAFTDRAEDDTRIINLESFRIGTWRKEIDRALQLPIKYDDFTLADMSFDNGSDAFLMIGQVLRSPKKAFEPYKSFSLYHFRSDDVEISDFVLNDSNLFVQSPRLNMNRWKDQMVVTGFYSNTNPRTFIGVYNLFYDLNEGQPYFQVTPFSAELVEALKPGQDIESGTELQDISFLEIIPTSEGGMTLVTENSSISSEEEVINVNGIPQAMSRNIYNYGNILVMSIDSAGTAKWDHVINKSQSSMNDGGYFSSAIVGHTRSNIYIIYNDQMRNNGDVMQYTVSNQGNVSNKILLRSNEDFISVIPGEARQIAYNELLLPTNKDRHFALLKLIYPK